MKAAWNGCTWPFLLVTRGVSSGGPTSALAVRRFPWSPAGAVLWMSLSKQELFDRIRRDSWQRQLSVRALSRKYGVHRRLVREALSSPVPTPRRRPVRTSPRMEPYKKTVDAWLRADLEAPRKQRHTVRRIVARIEEEFGEAIPYPTVRDFVAARRKEIAAQAGAPPAPPGLHRVASGRCEGGFRHRGSGGEKITARIPGTRPDVPIQPALAGSWCRPTTCHCA